MSLINKDNLFYRVQQFVIFILHLVLLKWMFYSLSETGSMPTTTVMMHFFGMSVYGALLIIGCAKWAKWHHEQELRELDHEK
jgi:apolipoprotein N-acyltransferase